jgi:hypothetical protein
MKSNAGSIDSTTAGLAGIAEILPPPASRHLHLTPELSQDLLLPLADGLLADSPFPGQVVLTAAVPEELADQGTVEVGQAVGEEKWCQFVFPRAGKGAT